MSVDETRDPGATGREAAVPTADIGGDPVCWLSRVCPGCGLFVEDEPPAVCGRCGARVEGGGEG